MQREEGGPRFPVQARQAPVRGCARGLALIATDAERLVDHQHIRRFAETVLEEERQQLARLGRGLHLGVFGELQFCFALHFAFELFVGREHVAEARVVHADRFGGDRRFRGDGARKHAGLLAYEIDELARRAVRDDDFALSRGARQRHRTAAQNVEAINRIAFAEQPFTRSGAMDLRGQRQLVNRFGRRMREQE